VIFISDRSNPQSTGPGRKLAAPPEREACNPGWRQHGNPRSTRSPLPSLLTVGVDLSAGRPFDPCRRGSHPSAARSCRRKLSNRRRFLKVPTCRGFFSAALPARFTLPNLPKCRNVLSMRRVHSCLYDQGTRSVLRGSCYFSDSQDVGIENDYSVPKTSPAASAPAERGMTCPQRAVRVPAIRPAY